ACKASAHSSRCWSDGICASAGSRTRRQAYDSQAFPWTPGSVQSSRSGIDRDALVGEGDDREHRTDGSRFFLRLGGGITLHMGRGLWCASHGRERESRRQKENNKSSVVLRLATTHVQTRMLLQRSHNCRSGLAAAATRFERRDETHARAL